MMLLDSKMPVRPSGLKAAGTVPKGCADKNAHVYVDTIEAGGDRRFPDPGIGQVGEDAQVGHRAHHVSPNGRISTLNDQALRSCCRTCQTSSAIAAALMKKLSGRSG